MQQTVALNRKQRRQKARQFKQEQRELSNKGKDRARIRRILAAELNKDKLTTGLELLNNCRTYEEDEIVTEEIRALGDFEIIRTGANGDGEKYAYAANAIAIRLTAGLKRSEEIGGGEALIPLFENARAAYYRMVERAQNTGRAGFDALGFSAIRTAIGVYLDIFRESSPQQMRKICDKIRTDIRKNKTAPPDYAFPLIGWDNLQQQRQSPPD